MARNAGGRKQEEAEAAEAAIGGRIQQLRTGLGLTLDDMAGRTGFTKGYLSKIENGLKLPPIASLTRIARALATTVSDLVAPARSRRASGVSVVRSGDLRSTVQGTESFGYDYAMLNHDLPGKRMEAFVFSFPAQAAAATWFAHDGEEFIYVLRGTLDFETRVRGKPRRVRLKAGDSIQFDSRLPHRGRGFGQAAQALVVIHGGVPEAVARSGGEPCCCSRRRRQTP